MKTSTYNSSKRKMAPVEPIIVQNIIAGCNMQRNVLSSTITWIFIHQLTYKIAAIFTPCRTPASNLGCRWYWTACRCCPAISWSLPPWQVCLCPRLRSSSATQPRSSMMLMFLLSYFTSCHDRSLSSITVFSVPRRAAFLEILLDLIDWLIHLGYLLSAANTAGALEENTANRAYILAYMNIICRPEEACHLGWYRNNRSIMGWSLKQHSIHW